MEFSKFCLQLHKKKGWKLVQPRLIQLFGGAKWFAQKTKCNYLLFVFLRQWVRIKKRTDWEPTNCIRRNLFEFSWEVLWMRKYKLKSKHFGNSMWKAVRYTHDFSFLPKTQLLLLWMICWNKGSSEREHLGKLNWKAVRSQFVLCNRKINYCLLSKKDCSFFGVFAKKNICFDFPTGNCGWLLRRIIKTFAFVFVEFYHFFVSLLKKKQSTIRRQFSIFYICLRLPWKYNYDVLQYNFTYNMIHYSRNKIVSKNSRTKLFTEVKLPSKFT